MVIREQRSMIMSTYYQYLLNGGARSLRSYVNQPYDGRLPMFAKHYFKYHYLIDYYQQLFGGENVLVLPHEMFRREPREFVQRLATFAQADVPDDLPYDTFANEGRNRVAEYHLRWLAPLFVKNSVNAYSPIAVPRGRWTFKTLKKLLGKAVPGFWHQRFAKAKLAEIDRYAAPFMTKVIAKLLS